MHSIFCDAAVSDDVRRGNLFHGQLHVYSPRPISIELCNLAGDMAREASHLTSRVKRSII